MDHNNRDEIASRRLAIRLSMKGKRPGEILKRIPRSRQWLYKWQHRFEQEGWKGLENLSRRPYHSPQQYPEQAHAVVGKVRRSLQKRGVGLLGPRAIQQEIIQYQLLPEVPGLTSIKYWLKAAGLIQPAPSAPEKVYYPGPHLPDDCVWHLMDWIARYIEGGEKVFAFHTLEVKTRALQQSLRVDKTTASVREHALEVWQSLGLPDFLQLDNDSAFNGGDKTPRRFGVFVRLALYLGIELIFIPPAEPERNSLIESLNGLWAGSFWKRHHFTSMQEVVRKSPKFTCWYAHDYHPPALDGLTPAQARRGIPCCRLTRAQVGALPPELPITAGRLHFIRCVSVEGEISLLGERWKVSKRLAHRYVWATLLTHQQRLEIYYRRSERGEARLVKISDYAIREKVERLRPEYRRRSRRPSVLKIL